MGRTKSQDEPFPRHPARLVGSAWTRIGEHGVTHFEIVAQRKDHRLTLRAIHGDEQLGLPWRELRDRTRWWPGWRSWQDLRHEEPACPTR